MTEVNAPLSERDEIEMLLPWYVSGRLDAADKERVERWIARDSGLARQLVVLEDDRREAVLANENVRLPDTLSVHASMAKITGTGISGSQAVAGGFFDRIREFFAMPQMQTARWALAAGAAIILLQSVWLGSLLVGREPTSYQTASGGSTVAADGTFALVRFADGASAKDIAKALSGLEMTIVDGPKPGGLFRVRIGARGLSDAVRDQRLSSLRQQSGLIVLVTPTTER